MCFTSDMWKSNQTLDYMAVTVHLPSLSLLTLSSCKAAVAMTLLCRARQKCARKNGFGIFKIYVSNLFAKQLKSFLFLINFFNYILDGIFSKYKCYFALIKVTVKQLDSFCPSLIYVQCSPIHVLSPHFQSVAPIFVYDLCIYRYKGHLKTFEELVCVRKWNACCLGSTDFPARIC